MKRFEKGDLAITCNSRAPLVNGNLLVSIVEVVGPDPERDIRFGYLIERVDGEPFAVARIPFTPLPTAGGWRVTADQHQLRPLLERPLSEKAGRKAVEKA